MVRDGHDDQGRMIVPIDDLERKPVQHDCPDARIDHAADFRVQTDRIEGALERGSEGLTMPWRRDIVETSGLTSISLRRSQEPNLPHYGRSSSLAMTTSPGMAISSPRR